MKSTALLFLLLSSLISFSQNCKPDLEKADKITKQENIAWQATFFESGFGNSLINTSDWYISMQFGRYGSRNLCTVFIDKYEESAQNTTFESQYKGEKGKDIYFAFSQGDPIKLTVQNTTTHSKMNNTLGKLVTTISLGIPLTPELIEKFKQAFDGGTLDAVRFNLANGMKIEKDVKGKRGKKLQEKFECFRSYNEQNPIKPKTD